MLQRLVQHADRVISASAAFVSPSGDDPAGSTSGVSGLPCDLLDQPVLVVEDEVMIAWMIESLLEDMGFSSVTIVSSGEAAVAAALRLTPALIVSDINLGSHGMDGIATAATIRSRADPLVLFVTAHAGPGEIDRIGASVPGALILRKPVEYSELAKAVSRLAVEFRRH